MTRAERKREMVDMKTRERRGRVVAYPLWCISGSGFWFGAQRLVESPGCHCQSPVPSCTFVKSRTDMNVGMDNIAQEGWRERRDVPASR